MLLIVLPSGRIRGLTITIQLLVMEADLFPDIFSFCDNTSMRLIDCLQKGSVDDFSFKEKKLREELSILRDQLVFLSRYEKREDFQFLSVYESAVIRTAKLTRNSGFTLFSMIGYSRQNLIRGFAGLVSPVFDCIQRLIAENQRVLEKIKHCRDRLIVHMDPRFAFDEDRISENTATINDLQKALSLLDGIFRTLFCEDIL